MRELYGKKVNGLSHKSFGFVVSQIPDFRSGEDFMCKVAWDVSSYREAESLPEKYLQEEYSDEIVLVEED